MEVNSITREENWKSADEDIRDEKNRLHTRRRGILQRMSDVVDSSVSDIVVLPFYQIPTHIGSTGTSYVTLLGRPVALCTFVELISACLWHVVGLLHEGVYRIIDGFDAVSVIDGKFRVVRGLYFFVNDPVDYAESIHLQ